MYNQAAEIQALIEQYDSIVIFRHRSPDLDAVGSQMGLKHAILQNYPYKKVYAYGDEKNYEFDFVDSYDVIDNDIIAKSLVIITDTANKDRVSSQDYLRGKHIIKIDHHQDLAIERYGDLNLVDQTRSSTCELLFYIFKEFKNFRLNETAARCLFIGMYADTGGFSFPNTKSDTFLALSELVKFDFNYEETVSNLKVYDLKIMQAVGHAYLNLTIEDGVGYVYFDKKFQTENDIKPFQISQVANFLGSIKELKAWIVFNQYKDFTRVNMRSRQKYDVASVAANFSGGGHKNAAGAMVYNEQEQKQVISKVIEMVNNVH